MARSRIASLLCSAISVSAIAAAVWAPAAVQAQTQAQVQTQAQTLAQAQTHSFDIAAQPASAGVRQFAQQAGIEVTLTEADAGTRKTNAVRGELRTADALDKLLAGTGLAVQSFDGKVAVLAAPGAVSDVVVVGRGATFATNNVTKPMILRRPVMGSVNDLLNELPGVLVNEADAFGSSDAATSISIRGFDTLHVGVTIDGMPNGGSRYGGGSKANRYLDALDVDTVHVSQGTADISSPSNEALAGTLDYVSSNPLHDRRMRFVLAGGDFDARQFYARVDTGEIAPNTYAWVSALTSSVVDWADQKEHTTRSHVSGKVASEIAGVDLTSYLSYDEANESEYGAVSPTLFAANPTHDSNTSNWSGIPYYDQYYRGAVRALRNNLFGYAKAHEDLGEVNLTASVYGHLMTGRGDSAPPYMENVVNDGAGQPNSEYLGGKTAYVAAALGNIYFVNPDGSTATMIAGCKGSAALPAAYNPACYPVGSIPVQSYRHTHYNYNRLGTLLGADWTHRFGDLTNQLRGGLWYEHGTTDTRRDWHLMTNAVVSDQYNDNPYWVQYDIHDGAEEVMYYAEDVLTWGPLTGRVGVKQFFTDQWRQEVTNTLIHTAISKDSKPLVSAGLTYTTPVQGLEVFGGYSQNFAGLQRNLLGSDQLQLNIVQPETANNIELGGRYSSQRLYGSLTVYDIDFKNRIVLVPANFVNGIDYLAEVNGVYVNVGGVKSRGVELALGYRLPGGLSLSGSYSYNSSKYVGTGNPAEDKAAGFKPGVQVANSPVTMFNLAADWRHDNWKVGVSSKYVGDTFIDVAATQVAKAYVVTNAYVGLNLGEISDKLKGLDLTITMNNIANVHYLQGNSYIGAPRTITAALTLDF